VVLSFVLHLLEEELAEGRVVGRIEDVASDDVAAVRDVDELLEFLRSHGLPARRRPGVEAG
jgi:hypothetical protein